MAWADAGLEMKEDKRDSSCGIIFGAGISGVDKFREAIYKVDEFQVRRLGSTVVINTMASGISAYMSGKIGAGNQVTTNSSACVTGTESIAMAYQRIKHGYADRMLAGSTSEEGPYIWGGFDSMRIMNRTSNDQPHEASRPLSQSAKGFVPGSGAGALVLEEYESAIKRGARIYAEIIGEYTNSGGHRDGGSMTAPNGIAVQECIKGAMNNAGISASEIDYINGHLTATTKDGFEIANWKKALGSDIEAFPLINSTKSTIGHCLSASGSIESVATILQMDQGVIYPSINCEDLHEEVIREIGEECIQGTAVEKDIEVAVSASFGFGDVNGCLVFKKV
jgi:3-oxoacyl-(acyl-carrier-protein) synthase